MILSDFHCYHQENKAKETERVPDLVVFRDVTKKRPFADWRHPSTIDPLRSSLRATVGCLLFHIQLKKKNTEIKVKNNKNLLILLREE